MHGIYYGLIYCVLFCWYLMSVDMPLWYAHYDNIPSFSDFSSFGGWTTPYAKQVMTISFQSSATDR